MTIRTDLLKTLSAHLRAGNLGHQKFDFSCFNRDIREGEQVPTAARTCGSNGCALGECPIVFPNDWRFGDNGLPCTGDTSEWRGAGHVFADAAVFFGINVNATEHLFNPEVQRPHTYGGRYLPEHASKEDVADNIDAFLALVASGLITETT